MTIWTTAAVIAWSLVGSATCCLGQQPEDFSDSALTREQWKLRVEESQRRAEQFVASAREYAAIPSLSETEKAEAASQRALNDPSLQRGDIVATGQGFVVFVGREDEHPNNGFLPAPDPRY
jgi:hypothetical protein